MQSPYSVAGLPATLMAATPTRTLWVDANAAPGGIGTAESPFATIQEAVQRAKPGTAIMVREGEYHENVKIPRTVSGTEDAPIWLISADGPQKAHVIAPDSTRAAISGGGAENIIVDGFHVTGGKNGIQFSQNGFDWTDMIKNIVIQNNVIDGVVQDGIKVNGGENVLVYNNVAIGGNDENIDFMSVVHGAIISNEVSGNTGTSAAIFAKGGSTDIKILGNFIRDAGADGISVGGWSNPDYVQREGYSGYEAKDVLVEGNRVENVGKRPLSFYGAQDSTARGNYLEATDRYYTVVLVSTGNPIAPLLFTSSNITIVDNYITRDFKTLHVDPTSANVVFANNQDASVSVEDAGAHIGTQELELAAAGAEMRQAKIIPITELLKSSWDLSADPTNIVENGIGTDAADHMKDLGALLVGGAGDDSYHVRKGIENIVEREGEGIDTVYGSGRYFALPEHVENLILRSTSGAVLVGNGGDNVITGNVGNDYLIGGGGQNLLTGGGGNDIFLVSPEDKLTRIADFKKGDLISIAGHPFADFADLQKALIQVGEDSVLDLGDDHYLVLPGVAASSLTAEDFDFSSGGVAQAGRAGGNKIYVNSTTHIATGTDGCDLVYGSDDGILAGGKGDDSYLIKRPGDHIVEHVGGGIDTVLLYTPSHLMEANVENVKVRTDVGAIVTGNNLANIITGHKGGDTIAGGAGADVLTGGGGADRFVYTAITDGGDSITDFQRGIDKLDFHELKALHADLTVTTADTDRGLAVYANHGGAQELMAVLIGVHDPLASGDLIL